MTNSPPTAEVSLEDEMLRVLHDPQSPRLIELLGRVRDRGAIDPSLMAELQDALVAETQMRLGVFNGPQ
jgi:hypothetical protein